MNEGAKFASATTATPMPLDEYTDEKKNTISPPKLAGDGNTRSLPGYHIRLGIDTTFVSGTGETALPIIRYAEGRTDARAASHVPQIPQQLHAATRAAHIAGALFF